MTLLNGWKSANGLYGTGDPAWAIEDGIVYLSGSLTQPGATPDANIEFAVLPPAESAFPDILTVTYTVDGTQGFVDVSHLGQLSAWSPDSSDAQQYTSLAGISYPAASTAQTNLPLVNGWQGQDTNLGYDNPAWTMAAGTVHLSGPVTGGTAPEFSVLPAFARPAHAAYFPVRLSGSGVGVVLVEPDGTMQASGTGSVDLTQLDAVSFLAASTAVAPLSLLNGWQSAQGLYGTGDPGYSVTGGIVHLSGSLTQPTAGSAEFATLPPSAWPSHYLYITTYAFDGTPGAVEITPTGQMYAFGPDPGDTQAYTSLAGVTFPVGSVT
jgi:hypothetical protein